MTFAEFFILVAVGVLLYLLLVPLRRQVEFRLYRFFRSKMGGKQKPIIDITDYRKTKDSTKDFKDEN